MSRLIEIGLALVLFTMTATCIMGMLMMSRSYGEPNNGTCCNGDCCGCPDDVAGELMQLNVDMAGLGEQVRKLNMWHGIGADMTQEHP